MRKIFLIFFFLIIYSVSVFAENVFNIPSLDKKIGQMVMIGFRGTDTKSNDFIRLKKQIKNGEVGGVLFLERNIESKEQTLKLIDELKKIKTTYPLLIAVDQEGGHVERLNNKNGFNSFPSAHKTAQNKSPKKAYEQYLEMAKMLKEAGFNLNLAPVVDLNIYPRSPAIGLLNRSFSNDPDTVIKYASQMINAHYKAGVLTSLKHYPAHGSADKDSHLGTADVTRTWKKTELLPFKQLIKDDMADTIMTAHIYNRNIDSKYPASLSKKHVQEMLREELGYDGVVITDDLQMNAIRNKYGFEETIIAAVNSGSDILLCANYFVIDNDLPGNLRRIIKRAMQKGKINENRVQESFVRIMTLKSRYGYFD